jgi:hypothetical protein
MIVAQQQVVECGDEGAMKTIPISSLFSSTFFFQKYEISAMLPDFRQWSTLSANGILINIFFFLIFSSFNPKVF